MQNYNYTEATFMISKLSKNRGWAILNTIHMKKDGIRINAVLKSFCLDVCTVNDFITQNASKVP